MSGTKISFGFSKIKKRPVLLNKQPDPKPSVEYISSVEEKKIKLCESETEEKQEPTVLIIPLKPPENKIAIRPFKKITTEVCRLESIKEDVKSEVSEATSLDALAVKELLEQNKDENGKDETLTVPLTANPPTGEAESSLDDYEKIPIKEFGLGMLRGMGWAPGKGIGLKGKVSSISIPKLRPRGMGLGADSLLKKKTVKKDT